MSASEARAWRCGVCGFVHRGDAPPEQCPVCGAPGEVFEPFEDEKPAPASARVERWRCLNCNFVHQGASPPEACPVCGVPAKRFEPLDPSGQEAAGSQDKLDVVILGAGIAGLSAAEAVRRANSAASISLVSKETELPYYRLNLTRYLAGEVDKSGLPIHPESWYADQRVELLRGAEVAGFDPGARRVALHGGEQLTYDKLILTIGAHPFLPPIPGAARDCVTGLRTVADADCILEGSHAGSQVVIIGGGILGLEAAGALAKQGCQVTMVEGFGWLLPRQLNERAGRLLQARVEALGIDLELAARVEEIVGDERARGVALAGGKQLPADLVVVAAGVRPNSYLARQADLEVNQGVVVDNRLRSSQPDIFAAGDVAEHRGTLYGIWAPSMFQGKIAGMNAAGQEAEFGGIPRSNSLKVLGLELFSIGQVSVEDGSYQILDEQRNGHYNRLVFRDGLLRGAILLGDAGLSSELKQAIEDKRDFSGLLRKHPTSGQVLEHLAGKSQREGKP